jgi:peptidoglycan/LPS O-acetylase OafA/YrhL
VSDRVYFKGIDGLRAIGALAVVIGPEFITTAFKKNSIFELNLLREA